MKHFLQSGTFWRPAIITLIGLGLFFLWELGYFQFLPTLPRPEPTNREIYFTIALIIFIALNIGLFNYQKKLGACPVGASRATKIAGGLGAIALLCPACLLIPISLLGITISLTFLAPYLPLLQIIALILLIVSTVMLWPKR